MLWFLLILNKVKRSLTNFKEYLSNNVLTLEHRTSILVRSIASFFMNHVMRGEIKNLIEEVQF
jgi:hypothetical protein